MGRQDIFYFNFKFRLLYEQLKRNKNKYFVVVIFGIPFNRNICCGVGQSVSSTLLDIGECVIKISISRFYHNPEGVMQNVCIVNKK